MMNPCYLSPMGLNNDKEYVLEDIQNIHLISTEQIPSTLSLFPHKLTIFMPLLPVPPPFPPKKSLVTRYFLQKLEASTAHFFKGCHFQNMHIDPRLKQSVSCQKQMETLITRYTHRTYIYIYI